MILFLTFHLAEPSSDYEHQQNHCHTGQEFCSVLPDLVCRKARGARDIGGKIETCRCIAAGKAAAHGPLSSAVFIMHLSSDVLLSLGAGEALP